MWQRFCRFATRVRTVCYRSGIEAASSKYLQKYLEIQRIARPRQDYEIAINTSLRKQTPVNKNAIT